MKFEKFTEQVKEGVEARLGVTVQLNPIHKSSGTYTGLMITGNKMTPVINMSTAYLNYIDGATVEQIINACVAAFGTKADIPDFGKWSWNEVKDKLYIKLVNNSRKEFLENKVWANLCSDIAVVPYIELESNNQAMITAIVTMDMVSMYNVSAADVLRTAKQNSELHKKADIINARDMIGWGSAKMMIVTNTNKTYGASVIMYDDVMKDLADNLGENLFVLPSSIHEVIVIPDDGTFNAEKLNKMVREINQMEVEEKDWLSDTVIYFNRDNGFSIA